MPLDEKDGIDHEIGHKNPTYNPEPISAVVEPCPADSRPVHDASMLTQLTPVDHAVPAIDASDARGLEPDLEFEYHFPQQPVEVCCEPPGAEHAQLLSKENPLDSPTLSKTVNTVPSMLQPSSPSGGESNANKLSTQAIAAEDARPFDHRIQAAFGWAFNIWRVPPPTTPEQEIPAEVRRNFRFYESILFELVPWDNSMFDMELLVTKLAVWCSGLGEPLSDEEHEWLQQCASFVNRSYEFFLEVNTGTSEG
jgi:hypothetical protein